MMHGISAEEKPEVVAMLRKLGTANGRRELLSDVAAADAIMSDDDASHPRDQSADRMDAAGEGSAAPAPSRHTADSIDWWRSKSCRHEWIKLVRRSHPISQPEQQPDCAYRSHAQVPGMLRDFDTVTIDELIHALVELPASTWSVSDNLKCMQRHSSHPAFMHLHPRMR